VDKGAGIIEPRDSETEGASTFSDNGSSDVDVSATAEVTVTEAATGLQWMV